MQGTELFKKRIKEHLDNKASNDAAFAEKYANEKKSIEECCDFIIGEVKKTKRIGFDDSEVIDCTKIIDNHSTSFKIY